MSGEPDEVHYSMEILYDREDDWFGIVQRWSDGKRDKLLMRFEEAESLARSILAVCDAPVGQLRSRNAARESAK